MSVPPSRRVRLRSRRTNLPTIHFAVAAATINIPLLDGAKARSAAETALQKRPGYAPAIRALTLMDNTTKQAKTYAP